MADDHQTEHVEEQNPALPKKRSFFLLFAAAGVVVLVLGITLPVIVFAPRFLAGSLQSPEGEMLLMGESEPTSLPLAALLGRADRALTAGELTEAAELYERSLELGAGLPVMRRLFDTAVLLGDRKKAESVLGLLSFRGVDEITLDALRGLLYLREGDLAKARDTFASEPHRPEQAYGLVLVNILEGKHKEAQESLQDLLQSTDPLLVHTAKTIQGAYDEFALFQDGKEVHLQTLLARALAEVGQCPVSLRLLEGVVHTESDYRDAWIVQGYCMLLLEQEDDALVAFQKAYALDPEKAETQYFLGMTHERLGNTLEASMFLGYALENGFQPKAAVREKIAQNAVEQGSFEEAAEQYRAILTESTEPDPRMYHALATLLIEKLNDVAGARQLALDARKAAGDAPEILDITGWTAFLIGKNDEAASFLTSATQQDPSFGAAWYHLGLLQQSVGSTRDAITSFRKAYDLSVGIDQELATNAAEKHNALVVE